MSIISSTTQISITWSIFTSPSKNIKTCWLVIFHFLRTILPRIQYPSSWLGMCHCSKPLSNHWSSVTMLHYYPMGYTKKLHTDHVHKLGFADPEHTKINTKFSVDSSRVLHVPFRQQSPNHKKKSPTHQGHQGTTHHSHPRYVATDTVTPWPP